MENSKLTEKFHTEFKKLAGIFGRNYAECVKYNEEQIRKDFLDPLIESLGWNIRNSEGYIGKYQEVIVEPNVNGKVPDYCIQFGGQKIFYIEAKKPAIKIDKDQKPVIQVREYGWNSKMRYCLLTDFEEFAVYNTIIKPKKKDKSSTAQLLYFHYNELDKISNDGKTANWKRLYDYFSKEYELNGNNRLVPIKGNKSVDEDFLDTIEEWRQKLAKDIIKSASQEIKDNLNELVQKTIDRIVFLRVCEDREIEKEDQLKNIAAKQNIYAELIKLFKQSDKQYNSGLFHFRNEQQQSEDSDILSTKIQISNKVLKDIINSLYSPFPYRFDAMPADILGSVYERFLGKEIEINGKRVTIKDKPNIKKSGGIYYTPSYIVDYIVENTIEKQLETKTLNTIKDYKVVDPACGSGSFLIAAYQKLLDWYLEQYIKSPEKNKKYIVKGDEQSYKLTITERKRILLAHIYGIDLDTQAVEVSKLSLLLKALEGQTHTAIAKQLSLFDNEQRVLPDLGNNIQCGNSLVGSDIYGLYDTDKNRKQIKAYDWKFGSYDCVIGNPPYMKNTTDKTPFLLPKQSYLKDFYQGKMDLWYFFAVLGIKLLKPYGKLGFIATNNWNTNTGAAKLRGFILNNSKIESYVDFNEYKVFQTASIQTMIFILSKESVNSYQFDYIKNTNKKVIIENLAISLKDKRYFSKISAAIKSKELKDNFIEFVSNDTHILLNKIKKAGNFNLDKDEMTNGIHPHFDFIGKKQAENSRHRAGEGVFGLTTAELNLLCLTAEEKKFIKPYYNSTDLLKRYYGNPNNKIWLIYTTSKYKDKKSMNTYPNLKAHLDLYKDIIVSDNRPYGLHRSRVEDFFIGEKIISARKCPKRPAFTYTDFNSYVSAAFYVIKTSRINLKYLTGLLNSSLAAFWLKYKKTQGGSYQVDKEPLLSIPLVKTNNKKLETDLIAKVETIIEKKGKELSETNLQVKKTYQMEIKKSDFEIDDLVFQIYKVTDKAEQDFIKQSI
ncbi:MAG: N-6 DNA methylase [Endomicrobium sp.]|jgi:adenine-specific DNA-methyltransferase|nr:N-6 DNA methylase [Endomicrobium sp.]